MDQTLPGMAALPGVPGMAGMPFGMVAMGSPSAHHHGGPFNASQQLNVTQLMAGVANMTAVEIVAWLQGVLLAALVRQYMFNDFFAGGLGLMLVGLVATQARRIWAAVMRRLFVERGLVQVHVARDDPAFDWLHGWLVQFSQLSSSEYQVDCKWEQEDCYDPYGRHCGQQGEEDARRPTVRYMPRFKKAQYVEFEGERVWVQTDGQMRRPARSDRGHTENDDVLALLKGGGGKEDLILSASSKKVVERVIEAAMEHFFKKEEESRLTKVFRWSCNEMYWVNVGAKKARPIESVVLDCDPQALLADAKRFLTSAAWYADRGIPHRRGFLLYGPPGCGKTSLIKALAGDLKLDVSLISLTSNGLSDDVLQMAMNTLPFKSVFVLEDVDAAFGGEAAKKAASRSGSEDELDVFGGARIGRGSNSLTFSGLLNAIDGITAQEGRIVVMTTNHIEKLDPALIRPGRIDLRLYLGLSSSTQAAGIFRRFYPDATPEQEARVAAAVPDKLLSPASLQGFFLEHRDDVEAMLAGLGAFVDEARGQTAKQSAAAQGSQAPPSALAPVPARAVASPDAAARPSVTGGESEEGEKESGRRRRKKERRRKTKRNRGYWEVAGEMSETGDGEEGGGETRPDEEKEVVEESLAVADQGAQSGADEVTAATSAAVADDVAAKEAAPSTAADAERAPLLEEEGSWVAVSHKKRGKR